MSLLKSPKIALSRQQSTKVEMFFCQFCSSRLKSPPKVVLYLSYGDLRSQRMLVSILDRSFSQAVFEEMIFNPVSDSL